MDIFNNLVRVWTTHFDICATLEGRSAEPRSVYLRERLAPKWEKERPRTWMLRNLTPSQFAQLP
jgi:hypothetical protein